jgi:hypothetical protein
MNTVKSYYDANVLNRVRVQYSMYKVGHPLFAKWMRQKHKKIQKDLPDSLILDLIENKKSMWIDSFGYCFNNYNPDIISIEEISIVNLLKGIPNTYFRHNLHDLRIHEELLKTVQPEIVVYFKSQIFKYLTVPELINKIVELKNIYTNQTLCIYLDLQFIDFNKLKYPITHIIDQIHQQLSNATLKRLALTGLLINI